MNLASRNTRSVDSARSRRARNAVDSDPLVLSALSDAVSEAVIVTDHRGLPVRMNDPAREAFARAGLPEKLSADAEYRGLRFFHADRVTPIAVAPPLLHHVAFTGGGIPYTTWVGEGDDQRAMSITARPFADERGRRSGAVIVARDMTEMFEATRIRDDFLRDAAHRLRGHVTTVAGYAELLETDGPLGAIGERLARATGQLVDTVDDLFRTAREDVARSIPSVDLSAALSDVCAVFIAVAAARGVTLQVVDEGCGRVRFDQAELRQILADLMSHAIEHCSTAGKVIVRTHREQRRTTVTIYDDGAHTTHEQRQRELAELTAASAEASVGAINGGIPPHSRRTVVRANQATLSVRPDHPVGTVASLTMIAV